MKRVFDFATALVALVVLLPLLVVLGFLIRLKMGTPIFFCQTRPGIYGQPFKLIKFRTMSDAVNSEGRLLPDDQRVTKFGGWLRSTSMDELPELWNVIRGDMSLVGPRPLLMEYLPLYTPEQARRHEVRPGITGWAQVNGRNAISWEDKFRLDVWYVDHHSIWLDLKVLFLTIWHVVSKTGVSAPGEATMPRFTGTTEQER